MGVGLLQFSLERPRVLSLLTQTVVTVRGLTDSPQSWRNAGVAPSSRPPVDDGDTIGDDASPASLQLNRVTEPWHVSSDSGEAVRPPGYGGHRDTV